MVMAHIVMAYIVMAVYSYGYGTQSRFAYIVRNCPRGKWGSSGVSAGAPFPPCSHCTGFTSGSQVPLYWTTADALDALGMGEGGKGASGIAIRRHSLRSISAPASASPTGTSSSTQLVSRRAPPFFGTASSSFGAFSTF